MDVAWSIGRSRVSLIAASILKCWNLLPNERSWWVRRTTRRNEVWISDGPLYSLALSQGNQHAILLVTLGSDWCCHDGPREMWKSIWHKNLGKTIRSYANHKTAWSKSKLIYASCRSFFWPCTVTTPKKKIPWNLCHHSYICINASETKWAGFNGIYPPAAFRTTIVSQQLKQWIVLSARPHTIDDIFEVFTFHSTPSDLLGQHISS